MSRVTGQVIPSEYRDAYELFLDEVRPDGGVQLTKKRDGRFMSSTLRVVMQLFREGTRMWMTKTKPERQPWVDEGAKFGLDGRAYFLKEFLLGSFSRGSMNTDGYKVPGWGTRDSNYITARDRLDPVHPLVTIHHKAQVGFSRVGGQGEVS